MPTRRRELRPQLDLRAPHHATPTTNAAIACEHQGKLIAKKGKEKLEICPSHAELKREILVSQDAIVFL
jgi:hypothetical protein